PETGVLRLPENILFESGQADLSAHGERAVSALAIALRPLIPCFANVDGFGWRAPGEAVCDEQYHGRLEAVLIEGHTDDRPIHGGRFRSNWDLSTARAIATFAALERAAAIIGRAENDREEQLVGVSGYGEHRPVASNDYAVGRRANRRIDLRFLMAAPKAIEADADG
ncbi:MAG: OmpA/MotB family protein, partial [Geminicoccaceae bacterium]